MLEPTIIYEDKNFLAIMKPAGLQVHAAKKSGASEPTLVDWLTAHYPEVRTVGDDPALRPGIVHRLDRETSGIMLVARNQKYFEYLKSLFQKHEVLKTYLAVVAGVPPKKHGTIDAPIGIRNGTIKRSVRSAKMAKPAVTEYRIIKTFTKTSAAPRKELGRGKNEKGGAEAKYSLLSVNPKTGRTHQIRVHLASVGLPVVGDRLYGPKAQPPWAKRLMLHALSVEFTSASGERMKFEAEPPGDLWNNLPTKESSGACE
jgi:23S rRNA pseudouridine1911/1915/1917 synthase